MSDHNLLRWPFGSKPRLWINGFIGTLLFLLAGACTDSTVSEPVRSVRIGLSAGTTTLDPHLQNTVQAASILSNIYDTLVAFDAQMRIEPGVATEWSNLDDLTWRFELRDDVQFHDGTRLDAEDVICSLKRARFHPETKASGNLVSIESFSGSRKSGGGDQDDQALPNSFE